MKWIAIWLLLLAPHFAVAYTECKTAVNEDIIRFMDRVFEIAQLQKDTTPESRAQQYAVAADDLLCAVHRKTTGEFDRKAVQKAIIAYIEHEEFFREPPPGFDPTEHSKNILLFSEIGRAGRLVHNNLMDFGWEPCTGGDR